MWCCSVADHNAHFNQTPIGATLLKNQIAAIQADLPAWQVDAIQATVELAKNGRMQQALAQARGKSKKS